MRSGEKFISTIKVCSEKLQAQANEVLKENDLTMPQGMVIRTLSISPNNKCTLKELEKKLSVSQPTLAGLVVRLEKKEFVQTYIDENDRRVKIAVLTEKGIEVEQIISKTFETFEKNIFKDITEEEKNLLLNTLNKILNKI